MSGGIVQPPPPTPEELDDLRRDAQFTYLRVGAPNSQVRRRAEIVLLLCDDLAVEIARERVRARAQHGEDDLPDSDSNPTARQSYEDMCRIWCDRASREGRLTYSHILEEECAEALTAAARGNREGLRAELVQVMTVCARWWRALAARDRRTSEIRGLGDGGAEIGGTGP